MNIITPFPKVFHVGARYIPNLFTGEVEITEKIDGCFEYGSKVILEDGSTEQIGKIVNQKLKLNVLSYNKENKNIESKPIINWHKNGKTDKWHKISVEGNHGQCLNLKCTSNHKILTNEGWKEAKDIKKGDFVLKRELTISEIQQQMILGTLLGDSSISGKSLVCTNGIAQREYIDLKKNILQNLITRTDRRPSGYGKDTLRLHTNVTPVTEEIYKICTLKEHKTVNEKWVKQLTPISLAFWYMDDGSYSKTENQKGYAIFHTEGFSLKENKLLKKYLKSLFNIDSNIREYRRYYCIALTTESTERLFSLIFPYIISSMKYKLYDKYKKYPCIWDNFNFKECKYKLVPKRVINIDDKYIPYNNYKYDIEVKDNHNFLVSNIVVHNSQFGWGISEDGEVVFRSKGEDLTHKGVNKMFEKALEQVERMTPLLEDLKDIYFYGEYLQKPKHNTLNYERVPKNNLYLFAVKYGVDNFITDSKLLEKWARIFDIESPNILYQGEVKDKKELDKFLEIDSVLGNEKAEGIVVKNYNEPAQKGNFILPISMGKYVREEFKERHQKGWKKNTGKGKLEMFIDGFRAEARWQKAVQHLKEKGELEDEPRDIAKLFKEVHRDLIDEEADAIKDGLYKIYKKDILRRATGGLAEWYKGKLAEQGFEEK